MFKTMKDGVICISLTGHRPTKLAGYDLSQDYYSRLRQHLINIIERALKKYQIVECHCGMDLGADTVWAQAIVDCQEKYGKDRIRFIAEIPDKNQPSRWINKVDRDRWEKLLSYAEEVREYAGKNIGRSYPYILNQRNIGMIKACDVLIAVYDGVSTGGTANAVRDGIKMNKYIYYIDPRSV